MKKHILFLCTKNSARSQMAQALVNSQFNTHFQAFSAATSLDPPPAAQTIEHIGLSSEGLRSKSIAEFKDQTFDFMITLCGKMQQECQQFSDISEHIIWDFEGPKTRKGLKPCESTLREPSNRLKMFVPVPTKKRTYSCEPCSVL